MSLKEFRDKFAGPSVSDDDALLNYFAGAESVRAMKAAGPVREYAAAAAPLLGLIQQLAGAKRAPIDRHPARRSQAPAASFVERSAPL